METGGLHDIWLILTNNIWFMTLESQTTGKCQVCISIIGKHKKSTWLDTDTMKETGIQHNEC